MRTISFIIFYTIVLTLYVLINYYIFIRGWQALPSGSRGRSIYLGLFLFLSVTYIAGRILERFWLGPPVSFLVWTGSFWLGAMVYFVLLLVTVDFLRLVNLGIPLIPSAWLNNIEKTRLVLFYGVTITVLFITLAAHINTRFIKVNKVDISLSSSRVAQAEGNSPPLAATGHNIADDPVTGDNPGTGAGSDRMESVNIALVSDVHLGSLTPKNHITRIVKRINSLNPDIILLAGDILDEDVGPVIYRDLGKAIENLYAPLGVYGVTGNHEYIGGIDKAAKYLTSHGIELIRDSAIKINNSFYLAGREDITINRFSGQNRKSLEEILKGTDNGLPVILMDHQPFNLGKAAAAGVDLFVAGHTHHGQLWPFNLITRMVYELSRGFGVVDGMKVYVSNGIGTWGPPMRLGSRPEIVFIRVNLDYT